MLSLSEFCPILSASSMNDKVFTAFLKSLAFNDFTSEFTLFHVVLKFDMSVLAVSYADIADKTSVSDISVRVSGLLYLLINDDEVVNNVDMFCKVLTVLFFNSSTEKTLKPYFSLL